MYLSRVAIDTKKAESMKALYNLERLHGMIESSFVDSRQRNLWRLDQLKGENYILLLSPVPPQTNVLPEQIGFPDSTWETKSYEKLLGRITDGSKWHFRLTVNPTKATFEDKNKRGKVKAITITSEQREWLKRQGELKGFLVQDNHFDITKSEWKTIKKNGREVPFLAVTFEGSLVVTKADVFCDTLTMGIGREKAYGMGLITVVPYG